MYMDTGVRLQYDVDTPLGSQVCFQQSLLIHVSSSVAVLRLSEMKI